MAQRTLIAVMSIDKFDRKDAEHLENSTLNKVQVQEWVSKGVNFYLLTDFMDLCNDQHVDMESCWISYITEE
jgi:hypothetical protein